MNPNETIRLLILNDSREEAERLISMLRNAGRPSRAKHIESEEGLIKLLQEQTWDILIAHDKTTNVEPAAAIRQIKRLNKDVPVIFLSEDSGTHITVDGLKMGACDVVTVDEDQHLLFVMQRELQNREQRQQQRNAGRKLKESERRSQGLLDSSKDAIAFVQDGLFLYANESFGEMFQYADKEDIECMPVIDMVAEGSQGEVKAFLKEFDLKGADAENTSLSFIGLNENEEEVEVSIEASLSMYDEEVCIQFLSKNAGRTNVAAPTSERPEAIEAPASANQKDASTGLYSRPQFIASLEQFINSGATDEHSSCLLHLKLDRFDEVVSIPFGIAKTDFVLSNIASFLKKNRKENETVSRFGDSSFVILAKNSTGDEALKRSLEICNALENHLIEIDTKTVQVTASIGAAVINEVASDAYQIIDQSVMALQEIGEGGNSAFVFEPPAVEVPMEDLDIDEVVQNALDANRFRLLFQPIISLRGSDEEHYEVLTRMLDDNQEQVEPSIFLNIPQENPVLGKIDRWVILESIKILSEHRAKGNHTRLIINISSHSLIDKEFLPWLKVAFKAAELSANAAMFQITETDTTNYMNAAKGFAEGLQEMGSGLSISHFGCSLNPFNALKHVDASYVKVDGSFTLDIQNNNESPETLSNLAKELHQLDKITLVPFVENASVLSTLWQAGVHYIQGHYLQAPATSMDYDFGMDN